MYQIEYAALKYYNSTISEECLYIGMLFNNESTGRRDFKYISNFSRFQTFDDEVDVTFVKMYLKGIKEDVEENIFNYNKFSLRDYIKIYVNEFRFTEVQKVEVEENEDYVDILTKLYLKFDFSKRNRLSKNDEKRYIKRILSSKNVEFSIPRLTGSFNEEISFDYVVNNKIGIKLFTFKDKSNLKKMIPAAKQWAFTADELSDVIQVIFMYDDSSVEAYEIRDSIINILGKYAKVFSMNEGIDYVLTQLSEKQDIRS